MQRAVLFLMLLLCVSCDFFESKELKTQKIIDQEIKEIDWNTIDQFPLFSGCDEMATKAVQKKCFEDTLLVYYKEVLSKFEFVLGKNINDTINVDFLIDEYGKISVVKISKNAVLTSQMPEFNSIIARGIKSLPALKPALKRGIPVKAKFRIPMIINTN